MTRQRALILEILQHSPKHLTADEIFAIAREKMPGIARGTVYRNLKLVGTHFGSNGIFNFAHQADHRQVL